MERLRLLLLPLSWLYAVIVALRNWMFDAGVRGSERVDAYVISVGNISAGGAGKTPLVEWLISRLMPSVPVAVVSRGYGRTSKGTVLVQYGGERLVGARDAGDELNQIAGSFPACTVVADEQRVRGARTAVELGARVVVLDDAFQHRMIARDADIVVMTYSEVVHGAFLIPAGNRREPATGLKRASVIAVTRCEDASQMDAAARSLRSCRKPLVFLQTAVGTVERSSTHAPADVKRLAGMSAVAFSGIGDPASFERTLVQIGVKVVRHVRFRDHHWYTERDIESIRAAWTSTAAEIILTTQKDVARLSEAPGEAFLAECPVHTVAIRYEAVRGGDALDAILKKAVPA
jgi:tetraacyldisaccharide 4'-kinase